MGARPSTVKDMLLASVFATLVALIGTIQHQTQTSNGAPLGLIFSVSSVFMASALIRDRATTKVPGVTFAITLAALIFLIGQNLSGDILIPGNDLGLYWSYGSIGTSMLVALWPKLGRGK